MNSNDLTQLNESQKVAVALEKVFKATSEFVAIGLTGRTGSGCTTTATLLCSERLPLPDIGYSHFRGNEARKYRIIKNFLEVKWVRFRSLQLRSVLTHYLLELDFSSVCALVAEVTNLSQAEIRERIGYLEVEYDEWYQKVEGFASCTQFSYAASRSIAETVVQFYFDQLPKFANKIRDGLKKLSVNAYTALYQKIGDNVRASGSAGKSDFNPKKIFSFAERIGDVVDAARVVAKESNLPCYLVIDAIRNPYEAVYLRDRFANFFLVSINTDNDNRLAHLRRSHKFTDAQILELDEKEYPRSLKGDKRYSSQNIQKCIEISDVHINNPKIDNFGTSELASQIGWYVSLMMHPGLVTPTSMESCMQIAYAVKKSSGCISRQVGAAVTDEFYSVKSVGWNSTPAGQVPCLLRNAEDLLGGIDRSAYSKYENNDATFRSAIELKFTPGLFKDAKKFGRNPAYCFKDVQNEIDGKQNQVHTRSLHAEENAFLQIAKFGGEGLKGGILFTTASPCELCAKKAYQIGIREIFYIDPYPGIATTHVLSGGGKTPILSLFRGAIGRAYDRLYQPIMPYKDELDMLLTIPKKDDELTIVKRNFAALQDKYNALISSN